MKIEQLLSEIEEKDICRFCEFWNIGKIKLALNEENKTGEFVKKIREVNDNLLQGEYTLTVTDLPEDMLEISLTQLVYEVYAFVCLNDEIWTNISLHNFIEFLKSRISILETEGWTVRFDHEPIFPSIKKCFLDQFMNRENELVSDKIFFIKYSASSGRNGCSFNESEVWIHTIFLQEILRIYFMDCIVNFYKAILEEYEVSVIPVNWIWGLNHCLYPDMKVTTKAIKNRERYLIGNLNDRLNEEQKFLEEMYHDRLNIDYREMFDIPEKVMTQRGMLHHIDKIGKYINVIAGRRQTTDAPTEFDNTIYMLGGCVFFGYAEEDRYTVSSYLQRILNTNENKKYRVVNLSSWGGNIDEEHEILKSLRYKAGDVVFISYAGLIPLGNDYRKNDISYEFAVGNNNIKYFNSLVHCNRYGYEKIAENIYRIYGELFQREHQGSEYIDIFRSDDTNLSYNEMVAQFYESVKDEIPTELKDIGAIVMNCNPFTYGHRYLIEEAAKCEKHLLIFVVEEDKSEFPFRERIDLVKNGTKDLLNVSVIPSGSLMISSKTFPEYFTKKEKNTLNINPSEDVLIFGKIICPFFHIKRRYVGEEPFDLVTRRYNEVMKEILPTYGVNVIEIKRKLDTDNEVISASNVRKCVQEGAWDKVRNLVPKTTYDYLKKKYRKTENQVDNDR